MHKCCPTLGALALCCAGVATARAQDPVQVAPNDFKVLLENDQVQVLDFHSKGGEKIPVHSHRAYLTYDISGSVSQQDSLLRTGRPRSRRTKAVGHFRKPFSLEELREMLERVAGGCVERVA